MGTDRVRRILRPSMALVALALALIVLGGLIAAPVRAGGPSRATAVSVPSAANPAQDPVVKAGEDVVVPAGVTRQSAVAAGGDVTVDGTVTEAAVAFGGDIVVNGSVGSSVVAFGGDITVNGSVGASVVAFGGDVKLGPGAVVGTSMKPADKTVVLFGGQLTQDPSAQVTGETVRYDNANWAGAASWLSGGIGQGIMRPWWGFSVFGWLVQAAICLVLGLVAAALLPTQMRAVQRQLRQRTAASLGWGALVFFVIVPAVLVVLVISVVGLLLVLPYAVFLALFYFFVITSVGALVASFLLSGTKYREKLVPAVVIGVLATVVISRVPVAGFLTLMAMAVFGAGAAVLAYGEHRRLRRAAVTPAPAGAPAGPPPLPGGAAPADTAPTQPAGYVAPWVAPADPPVPPAYPSAPAGDTYLPAEPPLPPGPGGAPEAPSAAPESPAAPSAPAPPSAPGAPDVTAATVAPGAAAATPGPAEPPAGDATAVTAAVPEEAAAGQAPAPSAAPDGAAGPEGAGERPAGA